MNIIRLTIAMIKSTIGYTVVVVHRLSMKKCSLIPKEEFYYAESAGIQHISVVLFAKYANCRRTLKSPCMFLVKVTYKIKQYSLHYSIGFELFCQSKL